MFLGRARVSRAPVSADVFREPHSGGLMELPTVKRADPQSSVFDVMGNLRAARHRAGFGLLVLASVGRDEVRDRSVVRPGGPTAPQSW